MLRRVAGLAAILAAIGLWMACGQVYRPVVIPVSVTPPNSQNYHAVFAVSTNTQANQGTVFQIDVSGDSDIGQANMGVNPTHAATLPNNTRVFVASAGSMFPGQSDLVTEFAPAADTSGGATGLGTPTLFTLPNVGADQISAITSISESGATVTVVLNAPLIQAAVGGTIGIAGVAVTGTNPSGYDGSFIITTVSGNTIQYTDTTPFPISQISESGNVVTVVTSAPLPEAEVGGSIVIAGVSPAGYDGTFTISAVDGSTIQYTDSVAGLSSTTGGTVGILVTGLPSGSGGTATVPVPLFCQYLPDYVSTSQSTAMYVANYGAENVSTCNYSSTDSVAMLSPNTGAIANIAYLLPVPPQTVSHPVAMTETPNGQNLYVLMQGDGVNPSSVVDVSPTDLSTMATIPVGINPIWAVARSDNQRVYVLTQGDGNLTVIDTTANAVLQSTTNLSVGVGANSLLYDPNLSRLYVTNPGTGNVFVYSTTGGVDPNTGQPNDTPSLLATISMTGGSNPPCASACSPVSVAALADGSRFYVASYELQTNCSDPYVGSSPCIIPMLTVFDALSITVKPPTSTLLAPSPSLSLLTSPQFSSAQYAVPVVSSCVVPSIYTPGTPRFRMFAAPSADSSHVYVSICDAGTVADIDATTSSISTGGTNTPDTLITDLPAPAGLCTGACGTNANITSLSIASGVVTFQASNGFTAGMQVTVSGLSSSAGLLLDGLTCTVLSTGLSTTQFECIPSPAQASVGSTPDSGKAIPQPPPQSPIFLLTGQ